MRPVSRADLLLALTACLDPKGFNEAAEACGFEPISLVDESEPCVCDCGFDRMIDGECLRCGRPVQTAQSQEVPDVCT